MSTTAIIAIILLVLSPVLFFLGAVIFKILWGYGPVFIPTAIAGYLVWLKGMDWLLGIPVAIMLGIVFAWFWQRSRIFLHVDRWVETHIFFDK